MRAAGRIAEARQGSAGAARPSTASCPALAGHASAGNLHFLLTPNFRDQADLERYDAFMHELVELIVDKYDGSLKAEHGTGINMAPFVEREWGAQGHGDDVAGQEAGRPGRGARPGHRPQPRPRAPTCAT